MLDSYPYNTPRVVLFTNACKSRLKFFTLLPLLLLAASVFAQTSLEIWEVQGDHLLSPYNGNTVTLTENIVTVKGSNFFFLQTPDDRADNNLFTSNAIRVRTAGSPPVQVGDLITLTGTVSEQDNWTSINASGLQITVISNNQALPTALVLDESFPGTENLSPPDLEAAENMLITLTATVGGPSGDDDIAILYTSSNRPMREPGIQYPAQTGGLEWDGNPENIYFDPDALNQPNNRFLSHNMTISASGIIVEDDDQYTLWPSTYTVDGSPLVRGVREASSQEITIASLNTLRLIEGEFNYNARVTKMARYISELMGAPDIIAFQEIGGEDELEDLANALNSLEPGAGYSDFFRSSNDNIHLGFLVKDRINVSGLEQLGKQDFLSLGGSLHDRPPLLLTAEIPSTPPTTIQVLNVHLRSLNGIEGSNANFVRTKRHEQAIGIAEMAQERQGEDLFIVGDFNAFPFSDGYVDVMAQISGTSSLGAQFTVQNITSPALTNWSTTLPQEEQYSFVFNGNAQILDHALSTQLEDVSMNEMAYVRGNADNAEDYFLNNFLLQRTSDHDGFVLFVQPDNPISNQVELDFLQSWQLQSPNPVPAGSTLSLLRSTPESGHWKLFNELGQQLGSGDFQAGDINVVISADYPPGNYWLEVFETGRTQAGVLQFIVH